MIQAIVSHIVDPIDKPALEFQLAVRKLDVGASQAIADYWGRVIATDPKLQAYAEECAKSAAASVVTHTSEVNELTAQLAAIPEQG